VLCYPLHAPHHCVTTTTVVYRRLATFVHVCMLAYFGSPIPSPSTSDGETGLKRRPGPFSLSVARHDGGCCRIKLYLERCIEEMRFRARLPDRFTLLPLIYTSSFQLSVVILYRSHGRTIGFPFVEPLKQTRNIRLIASLPLLIHLIHRYIATCIQTIIPLHI
jgi:hypothetical protein